MTAYYNENDTKAAAWLRELIKAGHIAPGDVDERSIEDVTPNDLRRYKQCHFFAGIGGWSYALRLAGVADDTAVWTGSCPCQPFSAAGKGGGFADERHLWPAWFSLIRQCRPPVIFGEQVASKDGLNWFDLVHADLEGEGYAVGVADLCAAGVGAPHIRQRLYFVADSQSVDRGLSIRGRRSQQDSAELGRRGKACDVADVCSAGLEEWGLQLARAEQPAAERSGEAGNMEHSAQQSDRTLDRQSGTSREQQEPARGSGVPCELADTDGGNASARGEQRSGQHGLIAQNSWARAEFLPCTDGKARPIEPGTFPLAYGIPHRVGLLRGYGNAIVAPLAAAFIQATGVLA